MAAKKAKLEEQFSEEVKKEEEEGTGGIFKNVAIFVNGYTGIYHSFFVAAIFPV